MRTATPHQFDFHASEVVTPQQLFGHRVDVVGNVRRLLPQQGQQSRQPAAAVIVGNAQFIGQLGGILRTVRQLSDIALAQAANVGQRVRVLL